MSELKVFQNEEFGAVRTITINGEPYFVGKDVADILGYSNTRDALSKHVDNEDKNTVAIHDGIPGNPNQVVINESAALSSAANFPQLKGSRDGLHRRFFPLSANMVYMLSMRC